MNEKEKMFKELLYNPLDETLTSDRLRFNKVLTTFNSLSLEELDDNLKPLEKSFGKTGNNFKIIPPFQAEYGYNIEVGDNFFANFNCTILDGGEVKFGNNCMIGPNVSIYTINHPLNSSIRNLGEEYGTHTHFGDNVWFGGNCVITPGSSLGNNVVVAAGSVVTKSFGDNLLIGGNPAKIIKIID